MPTVRKGPGASKHLNDARLRYALGERPHMGSKPSSDGSLRNVGSMSETLRPLGILCQVSDTRGFFPVLDGFDDRLLADQAAILSCEPDDVET